MVAGLSTALTTALSGLNINQQQLAVVSQNIANANTQGYSREIGNQQAVYLSGEGAGVSVTDVTRQVNQNLVGAVRQQNSTVGQASVLSDYHNRIQLLLGQPGNNNSLDTFVSDFFNNMQSLAQTPQNTALQQAAVNSGVTLAGQIQQTAQGLQSLQFQADGDIKSAIDNVNSDLTNLAEVNHNISDATLLGQSVGGLSDQRDTLLNNLAQYINIQTTTQSDGAISITTGNGTSLLDSATTYQLSYTAASSVGVFANNGSLSSLLVYRTDEAGNRIGTPVQLASGGTPAQITSTLTSGKIAGLLSMRDQQIPGLLTQLDTLAANLRDQVNIVENSGSGFPGAGSLTGERAVGAQTLSQWNGSVHIAVLNSTGQAATSPYADETNGKAPLNLDLSTLNSGHGEGNVSTQDIIDAINQYYGPPQNKVEVGNLNNIQVVSDSSSLPGSSAQFNFDLGLDNISASTANLYVSGVTVQPSGGANTTTVTLPAPTIAISNYQTTMDSGTVTVHTTGSTAGLTNGETVYLSDPGTSVDGIAESALTGTFVISNVGANSFTITAAGQASSSGTVPPVGTATVTPPYAAMPAGQNGRTVNSGLFNVALGSNSSADYYTVTLDVAVDDGKGPVKTSQITYQITNNQSNLLNTYYAPQTANGDGVIVKPTTHQPLAQALLVDANGNELPKDSNGNYITTQNGFLKIKAGNSSNLIAIDSLNSSQQGQPANDPPIAGSNQGFSQYFNLNNFFKSNSLTTTGDAVAGSAANLQVEQRLRDNPGLISLGTLTQGAQPADPTALPNYTYVRNPGDNSVIQQLASLGTASVNFPIAGGLGATTQSFGGYAGAIIGSASSNAATATTTQTNAQTLLDGFTKQASTISGVNLDTELANTVIYQNAYTASARVISVTSTLFDALLQSIA